MIRREALTQEVPDVDDGESPSLRSRQATLSERPHGCRVAADQTADPASQARWRQAHGGHARGGQRCDVCAEHRLPVALHPKGPATAQHGERLLLSVGLGRHTGEVHHVLYVKCREQAEREASPTACVIDSQSVKSAEKGALASTLMASMPAS